MTTKLYWERHLMERKRECRIPVRERQFCSGDVVGFVTWRSSSYMMIQFPPFTARKDLALRLGMGVGRGGVKGTLPPLRL